MKEFFFEHYQEFKHKHDVERIVRDLRAIDKKESLMAGYESVKEAIETSLLTSEEAYVVKDKDYKAIWLFGIQRDVGEKGRCIWCVATDEAQKHKRDFVFYSKKIIARWLKEHKILYNAVSPENKSVIRWLKSLGAEFSACKVMMCFELKGEV